MKKNIHFFIIISAILIFTACEKENPNPYGNGNGNYTFWIESDLQCGDIEIFVDGDYEGTITHYHSAGVTCGEGDVNVVGSGSHSWNATSQTGLTWSGTLYFDEEVCTTMQLTGSGTLEEDEEEESACSYSLDGTWTRQGDGGSCALDGMTIYFSGGEGVIQSVQSNACDFTSGQVKWKNFDPTNCTIDVLEMPSGDYISCSVSFTDGSSVQISGNPTHTK